MVASHFVKDIEVSKAWVEPSYLLESPYREVLTAVSRGDGKYYSVLRKAKLSEGIGEKIVQELIGLGVLRIEYSREAPLKVHPKQKIKKEHRAYRIQDKLRFVQPFLRFWFGFVSPYMRLLESGNSEVFLSNFKQHYERLRSLVYEQLCNDLLCHYYEGSMPLVESGSYWDIYSEFDILAVNHRQELILGECKYTERHVCKSELTKLKAKALHSGIKVDTYALFSKNGFSNELLGLKGDGILLFDLEDLRVLL